jgi:hypothetical protein
MEETEEKTSGETEKYGDGEMTAGTAWIVVVLRRQIRKCQEGRGWDVRERAREGAKRKESAVIQRDVLLDEEGLVEISWN